MFEDHTYITKSGYRSGATSHLLYMNDTKLYDRTEQEVDSLVYLNRIMTLGYHLEKTNAAK